MDDGDYRQQQEAEEERMHQELEALESVWRAGLYREAEYLACELGLSKEFRQQHQREVA